MISSKIIGPHDQGISDSINANLEPRSWTADIMSSPLCFEVAEEMCNAYFEDLANLSYFRYALPTNKDRTDVLK